MSGVNNSPRMCPRVRWVLSPKGKASINNSNKQTNKQANNPNFSKSLTRLSIVSAHDLTLQWPHTK